MEGLTVEKDVLDYFMSDTRDKFVEVNSKLDRVNDKMEDLTKFKAEMLVSSRWVSMIVSAACGLITMAVSAAVSYYVQVKAPSPSHEEPGIVKSHEGR